MEQPIFTFKSKIAENTLKYPCPVCGCGTTELLAPWKFEDSDDIATVATRHMEYTGIRRCLSDTCDAVHVPSMPEVRP